MPLNVLRLEVVNGPLKGHTAVVSNRGSLVVGRLPECGLSIPQDLAVSRQHFQVIYDFPSCQLTHLSQTSETFVNGAAVSVTELRAGDEISFGDSNKIRVVFEETRDGIGTPTVAPGRSDAATSKSVKRITKSIASCGWTLYESAGPQPDYNRLLDILIDSEYVTSLIDFRRIGSSIPTDLAESKFLFSWMPPGVREQFSPVLIPVSGNPSVAEIVRAGWGKDAIVTVGSKMKEEELLAHWRKAIGADGEQPGKALTAYYWPSILNMILTCQSSEQVEPLLGQLTWLFVEDSKSPGNWHFFSNQDFSSIFAKAGLEVAQLTET